MTETLTPEDAAKLIGLTDILRRAAADRVAHGLKELEALRAETDGRLQRLQSELTKPLAPIDARAAAEVTQESIDEDNRKPLAGLVKDMAAERALLDRLLAGGALT